MTPFIRRAIDLGLSALGVLVLVLSALYSNLEFQSSVLKIPSAREQDLKLPPSAFSKGAALNYRTLAADVFWIAMVVDYGKPGGRRPDAELLLRNGHIVADLDPHFRRLYSWVPAVAISQFYRPSESDLADVNKFIDRGIAEFPSDGELPFSAAMNFIGYSTHGSKARRIRESHLAIDYLEKSLQLPNTPSNAPFVLSWFINRRRKLLGQDELSPADRDRLVKNLARALLTTTDQTIRPRIELQLRELAQGDPVATSAEELKREFEAEKRESEFGFLPDDLWVSISCP